MILANQNNLSRAISFQKSKPSPAKAGLGKGLSKDDFRLYYLWNLFFIPWIASAAASFPPKPKAIPPAITINATIPVNKV